jgi:hypothetical protein
VTAADPTPYTDHRPPHARTNSPAHQIDLFCTAFTIKLFELLPAPIGGDARVTTGQVYHPA